MKSKLLTVFNITNTYFYTLMSKDFWMQIKEGDESAFSRLYNENAGFLFGYGMKIVPNEDLVAETIQSLFVYIFEKRRTISCPESIMAYLCISLKRMLIRAASSQRTSIFRSVEDLKPSDYDFDLELDVESALIRGEFHREYLNKLQVCLNQLSPQQREVVYLKFYKGCNNDEIAQILGTSNQVVRNIASKALLKMRGQWGLRMILKILSVNSI